LALGAGAVCFEFDRDHLVDDEHPLGEATLRISGIELMKALDVWRVEEGPVRRGLLRRALGCTASDKEH